MPRYGRYRRRYGRRRAYRGYTDSLLRSARLFTINSPVIARATCSAKFSLKSGAATSPYWSFAMSGNNIYETLWGGQGNRAKNWASLNALYGQYYVYASRIDARITNPATAIEPGWFYVHQSGADPPAPFQNYLTLADARDTTYRKVIGYNYNARPPYVRIIKRATTNQATGNLAAINEIDNYWANFSKLPNKQYWWVVGWISENGNAPAGFEVDVNVTYFVKCRMPKLAQQRQESTSNLPDFVDTGVDYEVEQIWDVNSNMGITAHT